MAANEAVLFAVLCLKGAAKSLKDSVFGVSAIVSSVALTHGASFDAINDYQVLENAATKRPKVA